MLVIQVAAILCELAGAILLAFSFRTRLKPMPEKRKQADAKKGRTISDVSRVSRVRFWLGLGLIAISCLLQLLVIYKYPGA